MLDDRARALARKQLSAAFGERRCAFAEDVRRARLGMFGDGSTVSGTEIERVMRVAVEEARRRYTLAWEILKGVVTSLNVPPSESLAEDLKREVNSQVHLGDLRAALNPRGYGVGVRDAWEKRRQRLEVAITEAKRKVEADIDLAVEAARRHAEARGNDAAGGPATYNYFTGTIGVLQIGPNATANVVQSVGPEAKQALVSALDELQKGLAATTEAEMPLKADVIDAIADIRAEIEKLQPNRIKLTSLLSGVGQTIQTVASLAGAYAALKAGAALLGIPLP